VPRIPRPGGRRTGKASEGVPKRALGEQATEAARQLREYDERLEKLVRELELGPGWKKTPPEHDLLMAAKARLVDYEDDPLAEVDDAAQRISKLKF
jgi:hypothetical protein